MATVTFGVVTFNTTAGDKTATLTPALDDLLVVVAKTTGIAAGTTAVADDGPGGTYTKIFSSHVTGGGNTGRLNVYVRDALISSAVSTIVTATQASSTGGGLAVYRVSGMTKTGATAILGSGSQNSQAAGGTPAPVLTQAALTSNPVIGAVLNSSNPAGVTPRSSPAYTEGQDNGYATPAAGLESMFIDSGETSDTITWGSTSASAFGSLAIELDSSGAGPQTVSPGLLGGATTPSPQINQQVVGTLLGGAANPAPVIAQQVVLGLLGGATILSPQIIGAQFVELGVLGGATTPAPQITQQVVIAVLGGATILAPVVSIADVSVPGVVVAIDEAYYLAVVDDEGYLYVAPLDVDHFNVTQSNEETP